MSGDDRSILERLAVIEQQIKDIPEYVKEIKDAVNGIGKRINLQEDRVVALETKMDVVLLIFRWTFAPVFSIAGLGILWAIVKYASK